MQNLKAGNATKTKFSPLTLILFVVLTIYVLFMLVIFAWVFITASKAYFNDYSSLTDAPDNLIGWPKKFVLFDNISDINKGFSDFTLGELAMNTIAYSVGCSLCKVTVTCVVAYLCARYDNFFSKIVYNVVIITMIVPIVGSQAAEIQMAKELLLYNKIWGIWLMRSNFSTSEALSTGSVSPAALSIALISGLSKPPVLSKNLSPLRSFGR